jgi:hypothetical protein
MPGNGNGHHEEVWASVDGRASAPLSGAAAGGRRAGSNKHVKLNDYLEYYQECILATLPDLHPPPSLNLMRFPVAAVEELASLNH